MVVVVVVVVVVVGTVKALGQRPVNRSAKGTLLEL